VAHLGKGVELLALKSSEGMLLAPRGVHHSAPGAATKANCRCEGWTCDKSKAPHAGIGVGRLNKGDIAHIIIIRSAVALRDGGYAPNLGRSTALADPESRRSFRKRRPTQLVETGLVALGFADAVSGRSFSGRRSAATRPVSGRKLPFAQMTGFELAVAGKRT
jgi:hypothetical protein